MPTSIAFVFPGQGSQYVGMGRKVAERYTEECIYEKADAMVDYDLLELMWNGPEEKLGQTRYTQPAIFVDSVSKSQVLKSLGIFPDFVLGHSLGEYSALVAAEVLDFGSAMGLVELRAKLMDENDVEGGMSAVLGLGYEEVQSVLEQVEEPPRIANYNSPTQIVISGSQSSLSRARSALEENRAKVIDLDVSGPFHTRWVKGAEEQLSHHISEITFSDPSVPVLSGVSGELETSGEKLKKLLRRQITSPVLWVNYLRRLAERGVDRTVEVGPGEVLQGLCRRIDSNMEHYTFEEVIEDEF